MTSNQELAVEMGIALILYFVFVFFVFPVGDDDDRACRRVLYGFGFFLAAACALHVLFCSG